MKIKTSPSSKSKRKKVEPGSASADLDNELRRKAIEDTFTRQESAQEALHLIAEGQAKLAADRRVHQQRLAQIRAYASNAVFQIMSDIWLQRKKSWDSYLKSWLKLLIS